MIDIIDSFKLILRNMYEKKGRVFLTVSGIIIGIFVFTFFIFVSQGLRNAIEDQFSSFGVNVIGVVPAGTFGDPSSSPGGLTDSHIAKIKSVISDYKYVAGELFYKGQYEYGRQKKFIISLAVPDENFGDFQSELDFEIQEGRDLRLGDRGVAVLGYKSAYDTFGENNPVKVGSSLKINGNSVRIIGILKERGDLFVDSSLVMPFKDLQEISDQNTYSIIRVSLLPSADMESVKKAIDRKLNPRVGDKFVDIQSPTDIINQFNMIIGLLTAIISFVSSVALIVGGINVLNTMYSNVIERTNEISVMKALGATNEAIRNLFLLEGGLLGILGSTTGFMMAYIFARFVSFSVTAYTGYNVPIFFSLPFFFGVIIVTTLFAMAFGTYPALLAAKTNPADNLRGE